MEIIDDALALSKEALELAESGREPVMPGVVLTKVASATYDRTAKALHKTGVFREKSASDISQILQNGGEAAALEMMEKLASMAAFPLDGLNDIGGDLVEKSANSTSSYGHLPPRTAVWQKAWDEASEELG